MQWYDLYSNPTLGGQSFRAAISELSLQVDYSHYKKLARTEKQVLDYIKILYHTAQVAHFSTMSNPTCQISLQGITVCKVWLPTVTRVVFS